MNDEWKRFLAGHWQRQVPKTPGVYPQAAYNGDLAGVTGVVYIHPTTGVPTATKPWGGWWWSEPLPDFPKPPAVRP